MSVVKLSRVAKMDALVPPGVSINRAVDLLTVVGKFGESVISCHPKVIVSIEDKYVRVRPLDDTKVAKAMSGTQVVLIRNAISGVCSRFVKKLVLVGVGYKAQMISGDLQLSVGFSQPVLFKLPLAVVCDLVGQTEINLSSHDKMLVGLVAAKIRSIRPPEPYKGKGIRYADEKVSLKEVKKK